MPSMDIRRLIPVSMDGFGATQDEAMSNTVNFLYRALRLVEARAALTGASLDSSIEGRISNLDGARSLVNTGSMTYENWVAQSKEISKIVSGAASTVGEVDLSSRLPSVTEASALDIDIKKAGGPVLILGALIGGYFLYKKFKKG